MESIKGYEVRERIGTGGFGAVYRAYQGTIGREVAIKVILASLANHPDFIRRFETEAQLIARLEHLHIVPLYDYWRDPDGAYLVMRWLKGGSLADALTTGAFDLESAVLLLNQIASALDAAHRASVIHRDLKPSNILLDEDGNAYLADFGIAKDLRNPVGNQTNIDAIVGTLDYISPEQARSETVTACTDIYCLGVVLYETLTGCHPFPNLSPVERLYKHLNEPLPLIDSLDAAIQGSINEVIQKATAKNPQHRYQDVLEMAAAFQEAAALHTKSIDPVEILTPREQEILHLIIKGLSNKEIAHQLTFTLSTVKWYVTQIYKKLHVRSRVQAIVRARELNLIPSSLFPDLTLPDGLTVIATESFQPANPYKGLRAFKPADHDDFFGQEKLIAKLISRLDEKDARFLAVVGPSGSGKSSVVKAGLIPALWRGDLAGSEHWFVADMLPGSRPLDELEIALMRVAANQASNLTEQLSRDKYGLLRVAQLILPDNDSELLVVIDQFEEVFTLVEDEAARVHFLELLYTAATNSRSRVRVVITLRADFYDRPLNYPEFGELMRTRMETLLPLSAEGLERAIACPAERVGVTFESGLVTTMIQDINYQPGALPLLQYALTELFEQRQGRLLTHEAYQAIGKTTGALAKRAEQIYNELNETGRETTRQLFLRLVTLGEGVEDTRRRVSRAELLAIAADAELSEEVIDTYVSYRLLSLDHDPATRTPTVEVAHEALLREWERLRNWLNESRSEIRLQRQLAHLADEWHEAKQDTSFLLHGSRLEIFEKWVAETQLALTQKERDFLTASLAEREHQAAREQERQAREIHLEKRSQNFLRGLVAVFAMATLFSIVLSGVAFRQRQIAQDERDKARIEQQRAEKLAAIAQARELVGYANANLESDGELSTLLALQAVNLTYEQDTTVLPEAETVLHQALQLVGHLPPPIRLEASNIPIGVYTGLNITADGKRVAFNSKNFGEDYSETAIADLQTGEVLYTITGEIIALSNGSDRVVTLYTTPDHVQLHYWDISSEQTPERIAVYELPQDQTIEWIDVSLDFRFFLAASNTGTNRIFDLTKGEEISEIVNLPRGKGLPQITPDGRLLAIINPDKTLSVLDTTTWQEIARLSPENTSVNMFFFGPGGRTILTENSNQTVTIWDTSDFSIVTTIEPGIVIDRMALSRDGRQLVIASLTGQAVIWDTVEKKLLLNLSVTEEVVGLHFDGDATHLVTQHADGRLQIWNLASQQAAYRTMMNAPVTDNGPSGMAYSPDGTRLVVGSMTASPIVWDVNTGEQLLTLSGHTARVLAVAWSPNGHLIATAGEDTTVMLWDTDTGTATQTFAGHTDSIYGLAFSADGLRVASSSADSTVRIWNIETGESLLTLEQPAPSKGIAFSPDGTRIAAGTDRANNQGRVRVWDSHSGELQLNITLGNTRTGMVAFSPDGTHILVGLQEAAKAVVIDAHTGHTRMALEGHKANVAGVAYSPDGLLIVTGGGIDDATVRIWDASTGQERIILHNDQGIGALRVAFSPDGKYLAVHTIDGMTRIYVLSIPELVHLAKERLTRWWTEEECQRYLHTETCPLEQE